MARREPTQYDKTPHSWPSPSALDHCEHKELELKWRPSYSSFIFSLICFYSLKMSFFFFFEAYFSQLPTSQAFTYFPPVGFSSAMPHLYFHGINIVHV